MMYQNKLVACLKVNGRILREQHGTVLIPFGSEYSILIKNLNSVRAKVKIDVDGTDATSGTWLVVAPNSSMELERFIKDGNWTSGNRFKFIERSGVVEAHRGIKADDGIVRVEYATERRVVDVPMIREYEQWVPVPRPYYPPHYPYPRRPFYGNVSATRASGSRSRSLGASAGNQSKSFTNFSASASAGEAVETSCDVGITVAGSLSNQTFHAVQDFPCDQSDVMILQLRGMVGEQPIQAPVTVDTKLTCASCGKVSDSSVAFCQRCGTALLTA